MAGHLAKAGQPAPGRVSFIHVGQWVRVGTGGGETWGGGGGDGSTGARGGGGLCVGRVHVGERRGGCASRPRWGSLAVADA